MTYPRIKCENCGEIDTMRSCESVITTYRIHIDDKKEIQFDGGSAKHIDSTLECFFCECGEEFSEKQILDMILDGDE
tara:strand:+ start:230 stop:460 length:231 start_codon:yes stop_codon:yes gene_type:complete